MIRRIVAVAWLSFVLCGGSAFLTWITTAYPLHLPLVFASVLVFGFVGARVLGWLLRHREAGP